VTAAAAVRYERRFFSAPPPTPLTYALSDVSRMPQRFRSKNR